MAQVIDPVCGMTVATSTAKFTSDYNGTIYYFCAPGCKKSFEKEPEKYLKQAQSGHDDHAGHGHNH